MNNIKFVLVGDHNCGMAALRIMLEQAGNGRILVESLKGEILDAKTKLIKLLQDRFYHTVFLIVIPITLTVPAKQWLDWLETQYNNLALSSYNLFSNAMIVFTHADKVCQTLDIDLLRRHVKEKCKSEPWENLLSSVGGRFVCVNSILQESAYMHNVFEEIIHISKPSYSILIHGNNHVNSSTLFKKLHLSTYDNVIESEHLRMKFYCYPDLDLFQGLQQPVCGDIISNLIGNRVHHGQGITLILLLISQEEIFSRDMKEMITDLPYNEQYRMDHKTEKYWWDYTNILFSFGENSNNCRDEVFNSIERNVGIKEVVRKAGDRFIWMSDTTSKEDIVERIQNECNRMKMNRNGREFIGGPAEHYPTKMKEEKSKVTLMQYLCCCSFLSILFLILLLLSLLFIIFFLVTFPTFLCLLIPLSVCIPVIFKKLKSS